MVSLANVRGHSVLKLLSRFKLLELCNMIGFKQILVLPKAISRAVGVLIYNSGFHYTFMTWFVRLLCGFSDKNKIPSELFGVMITHEPGGASANNALHWVQCFRKSSMHRFDYGEQENLKKYGQPSPPAYGLEHIEKIPFKTYLFRGMKDAVMNDEDFSELVARYQPQLIETYDVEDYHHLEYIWSETAHNDIYERMRAIVDQHSLTSNNK